MPLDDFGSVALVKRRVVATGELVAIGGDESFEGLAHKDELQVRAKALVDLGGGILRERTQVARYVSLVGRNGEWVAVAAVAC